MIITNCTRVKVNAAKCLICGDLVVSKDRHDLNICSCGNISVDGGFDYLRRAYKDIEKFQELGEFHEDTKKSKTVR